MPLAVDPQFLAFERQFNQAEGDLGGAASRRKAALSSQYARSLPQFAMAEEKGLRNVGDDFNARGVFSSGIRVQRQNEVSRESQMGRDNAAAENASQMSDVDYNLAQQIADLRRRRAEGTLTAQQNSSLGPLNDYMKAYGA